MTDDLSFVISASTLLRERGVRTQLYCENKKLKAKLSYASKLGAPFAVLVGEDEIKEGNVMLKDMRTGVQQQLLPGDAANVIMAAISAADSIKVIKQP